MIYVYFRFSTLQLEYRTTCVPIGWILRYDNYDISNKQEYYAPGGICDIRIVTIILTADDGPR